MTKHITTAILAIFLLAGATFATPLAEVTTDASGVYFLTAEAGDYQLTVSGPDGFYSRQMSSGSTPSFSAYDGEGQALADGTYTWELVALPGKPAEADRSQAPEKRAQSGAFTVAGGSIANPDLPEEGFEKAQTIATDLIVQGSGCVGFDCTSSESFGFDTFRLKENNLRIHFDDTSSSASFPGNDWRLTANDSSNGGANYFAIEDATAGRTPFKVEAGAIANALYVDSDGDVGVGTANPVVEVHAVDGNTPTLRLEQDGSSGFTPQTWDLAGNETNFFIRDVTGGSKLPFRIKPGAPDDSIFIKDDGSIGIGTDSPAEEIHVKRSSGNAALRLETTDSTGADWIVRAQNNGSLQIRDDNATTIPMRVGPGAQSNLLNVGMSADGSTADTDAINVTGEMFVDGDAVACISSGGQLCACGSCP